MGGEGPYVSFWNEDFSRGGASTKPPIPMDDKQLDEAYTRAHAFLLERVRQLVELGWKQHETDGTASSLAFHHSPRDADVVIHRFAPCVLELHTRSRNIPGRSGKPGRATSPAHCRRMVRTISCPSMEENIGNMGSFQCTET